jgi:hypothetical protein
MALPIINAADESITDLLLQNNSLLTEVVSRLDEQVNVAKNVAEQERIRIENEQYSAVEAASEMGDSGGMLGRGMASAYTGAQAELGNLKGLFPFGGIGAVVGGGILASLIYMFRDSITEFLQENAADALEMLGVGEDLTGKVTEFLSNAAGVGIGASIGKIFGFRGALLGGLLGYIVSDYGIGNLFDEDSENDQAVYDNFFDTLKTDPSKVGLELGGLLALLGKWRAGLLIGIGSFVFEKMDLGRLFTEEGREDILNAIEEKFDSITDRDLGISDAIGVLMASFLGSRLVSGVRNGFASLFTRRTPATTPAPNQAEIDERLRTRTSEVRSQAAQQVLQSVDDAELERAGLRKVAGGGIQQIGGRGFATADQLAGAVDRFGLGKQFETAQLQRLTPSPSATASSMTKTALAKIGRFAGPLAAAGINIYAIASIWSDDSMSDSEKIKQTSYYVAGIATGALGSFLGGIAGAAAGTLVLPLAGTAVGGFVGMVSGGALGFFAGETLVKLFVEWLTSDSDEVSLPTPDAGTEQEARAQMNATALDNIIGIPGGMNIAEPVDTPLSTSNNSTLSQKQAELQGLNMRLTSRAISGRQRTDMESRRDALAEEIRSLENSGARIEDNSSATDIQSRIGGSVGTNEVSGLTSNLRESSVIVASSPVTNIINNNTTNNTSGGGSRSGNVPAGRSYNIDQSFNGVQRPAYA